MLETHPSQPTKAATCSVCGTPLASGRLGARCPRCLLSLAAFSTDDADVEPEDSFQTRSFGDYELLEEIARGGMGVVYRARQMSLGREVAVKMILAGELATTESVQRFRNEAAMAARLDHPNIVSVYEIGELDMQHYFSMRLVLGKKNIAMWARGLSGPPGERAKSIAAMMAQVAHAVAFAHERGVLHRDLKPSNILVDEQGEPQVTDFGLAKLLNEQDSGLTLSAVMLGSPSYMAPEQADGRHGDVTTLTDVYGLGAVLYELLARRPPFAGLTPLVTAKKVVEQMPAALAGVPRDLATICLKCLAKKPAQRYASAHELASDLERFSRGEAIHARPVTVPEAIWRWARRSPKVAVLLAAVLGVFVLGFAGVTWQWQRAEAASAEQRKSLAHLEWVETARQAETDEAPVALSHLAKMLRAAPERWQAAMLAMSLLDQRAFPMLAGPPVLPEVKLVTPPCLAPDGSWFAAACEDKTIRIWETATGRERDRLSLDAKASVLAASAGPLTLAVATPDGRVRVRADTAGPWISLPRGAAEPAADLSFSADGSRLMARSKAGVEVWDGAATREKPWLLLLDGGVVGAALSANGRRVMAWNKARAAVWDETSPGPLLQVQAQSRFMHGALAAGGGRMALIDGDYTARTWQTDTGVLLSSSESSLASWHSLALNEAGTRLTIQGNTNDLSLYDTTSGLVVTPQMKHFYYPHSLVTSADGSRQVSFGNDGRACVWDANNGQAAMSAIWLRTDSKAAISLSQDAGVILLYPDDNLDGPCPISIWRATRTNPPRRQRVDTQRDFNAGRLSPDGRLGCLGLFPGNRAYLYELATGRVLLDAVTRGHVYVHLFSPEMQRYYVFTANGWRYGWDLKSGRPLWEPRREPGQIRPAEISPDGSYLLAGHNDGHIRIYESATGNLVRTLDHPGEIKTLRFAPDRSGRFLTGSRDRVAHLWDLKTGKKLRTFAGHAHTIISSAWSPDSRLVATASYDHTARVWDVSTGQAIGQPLRHLAWLSHLEFSPDGRLLATACRDGTVRLWHPRTGQPASAPLPQSSTAETVRFTRDGACFLVRDHSGFRFWDTAGAEPVTVAYSEPVTSGLGMDAESWRAILSPDGRQVFLGYSINEGVLWDISQPRGQVPAWFPDLLESLALIRTGEAGEKRVISGVKLLEIRQRLAGGHETGDYADWARRVLRVAAAQ